MVTEQTTVPDEREQHIRALARLMTEREVLAEDVEAHLQHREYGLALYALAHEVLYPGWTPPKCQEQTDG